MDDQYPKLVVESQLARRRLAQAFEPGADSEIERQFLPVSDRTLAIPYPCNEDLVPAPVPFDHARAAAFEERLVGALNSESHQTTVT